MDLLRSVSQRVVFVRVGWMLYYGLKSETSGPIGGGRYNEKGRGSEVENFRDRHGTYYGFAQVSRVAGGFNLDRVAGEQVSGDELRGVLVVAVARRPGVGQVVVAWHAGATLLRTSWDRPGRAYGAYNFEAPFRRAVLLPVHHRRWRVQKGSSSGMGQANVFYPFDGRGRPRKHGWLRRVLERIAGYRGPRRGEPDPVVEAEEGRRLRVELDRLVRDPALVEACLARDGRRCRFCGFEVTSRRFPDGPAGVGPVLHAHHVRPLADGKRRTRLADLVTLCPTCHAVAHSIARATEAVRVDLDLLRRFYRPEGQRDVLVVRHGRHA